MDFISSKCQEQLILMHALLPFVFYQGPARTSRDPTEARYIHGNHTIDGQAGPDGSTLDWLTLWRFTSAQISPQVYRVGLHVPFR